LADAISYVWTFSSFLSLSLFLSFFQLSRVNSCYTSVYTPEILSDQQTPTVLFFKLLLRH
jgi:hypothetical protein